MAGIATRSIDPRASFGAHAHHDTHRQLLHELPIAEVLPVPIDAILVPTARPAEYLREAMRLAKGLGCGVVALCSDLAKARDAAEVGDESHVSVVAIDVMEDMEAVLPAAHTGELMASTTAPYPCDTSTKRNLGLLLSHVAGWERILFLDDDIAEVAPSDARAAAGLLQNYAAVGMLNEGYPDNSIVCHANRILRGSQTQFIGAGAMAATPKHPSYFPCIYNDDWFYLLGTGEPPRVAVTGRMKQLHHDPFADPASARLEEFGDCLAEGLYWLLDNRVPMGGADSAYWDAFLTGRASFIRQLLGLLTRSGLEPTEQSHVEMSLTVALQTCEEISSDLCVEYIRAWRADLAVWQRFLGEQPIKGSLQAAMRYLGLPTAEAKWPWPADGAPALAEDRLIFWNGWECAWAGGEGECSVDGVEPSSQLTPAAISGGVTS